MEWESMSIISSASIPAELNEHVMTSFAAEVNRRSRKQKQQQQKQEEQQNMKLIGDFNHNDVILGIDNDTRFDHLFPGNISYREHIVALTPLFITNKNKTRCDTYDISTPLSNPVIQMALEHVWAVGGQFYLIETSTNKVLRTSNSTAAMWVRKDLVLLQRALQKHIEIEKRGRKQKNRTVSSKDKPTIRVVKIKKHIKNNSTNQQLPGCVKTTPAPVKKHQSLKPSMNRKTTKKHTAKGRSHRKANNMEEGKRVPKSAQRPKETSNLFLDAFRNLTTTSSPSRSAE